MRNLSLAFYDADTEVGIGRLWPASYLSNLRVNTDKRFTFEAKL